MESQRLAIAAHLLVYLAYRNATSDKAALASSESINAANLRRAHALLESGTARGKIVLEGF